MLLEAPLWSSPDSRHLICKLWSCGQMEQCFLTQFRKIGEQCCERTGHSVGGRNLPEVLYLCIQICASLVGDYSRQVRKLVLEAADPQRQGLPLFGVGDISLESTGSQELLLFSDAPPEMHKPPAFGSSVCYWKSVLHKEPSGSSGSAHPQLPQTAGRALSNPSDLTRISCAWKLLVSRLSASHLVVKQTGNFIVNLGETNLLIQHRVGPGVSVTKLLSHPWRLISASQHCSTQIWIWHSLCLSCRWVGTQQQAFNQRHTLTFFSFFSSAKWSSELV